MGWWKATCGGPNQNAVSGVRVEPVAPPSHAASDERSKLSGGTWEGEWRTAPPQRCSPTRTAARGVSIPLSSTAPHPPPAAEAPSAGNRLPAPPPRMAPAAAVPLVGSPATEELRSLLHDHQGPARPSPTLCALEYFRSLKPRTHPSTPYSHSQPCTVRQVLAQLSPPPHNLSLYSQPSPAPRPGGSHRFGEPARTQPRAESTSPADAQNLP